MKSGFRKLLAVGFLSAFGVGAQGAIVVNNPSFEAQALADGGSGSDGDVSGWNVDRGYTAVANLTAAQFSGESSIDGSNFVAMNSGILHQDLGTMVAGQTYQFDISYGTRNDIPQFQAKNFIFLIRPNITSTTAFAIAESPTFTEGQPTSSNITVAPQAVDGSGNPIPGILNHAFLTYTATPADEGQPMTLQLQVQNGDLQLDIDRVALTTTSVPEPALMSAIGLAGLVLSSRRRVAQSRQ